MIVRASIGGIGAGGHLTDFQAQYRVRRTMLRFDIEGRSFGGCKVTFGGNVG